jgi:hypothetical protein
MPPETLEVALHEFHHLGNGRVTHTWHLEDWFGMIRQIGAWPPRAASGEGDAQ